MSFRVRARARPARPLVVSVLEPEGSLVDLLQLEGVEVTSRGIRQRDRDIFRLGKRVTDRTRKQLDRFVGARKTIQAGVGDRDAQALQQRAVVVYKIGHAQFGAALSEA